MGEIVVATSDIEQNERLARIETFNDKVVEPSLIQILDKLEGLVSEARFNERNEYVDRKILELKTAIGSINERNRKLDGNVFIKAIIEGERKLVGVIIKWTGITVLICAVGVVILMQFANLIQQHRPEVHETIKEVKKTVE
jgi:hypothetical protein